jgi:hypothetical protein
MRLHPLIRAIRKSSALQRAARGIGRCAGLMSQFWRQLFGRGRPGGAMSSDQAASGLGRGVAGVTRRTHKAS